jgi:hypothetical protein
LEKSYDHFYKIGTNSSLPENHRPTSQVQTPSQRLERLTRNKLQLHLASLQFFRPQQHGFRQSHPTTPQSFHSFEPEETTVNIWIPQNMA